MGHQRLDSRPNPECGCYDARGLVCDRHSYDNRSCEICNADMGMMSYAAFRAANRQCGEHDSCPDCGEHGERKGHETCQDPQD